MIPTEFELAHITITFTSPMIVSDGVGNDINDSICITDANGYPSIPGTSIAGALRHAFSSTRKDSAEAIFGKTDGDKDDSGSRSLLTVSWAMAHDSNNRPVSSVLERSLREDKVLSFLKSGVHRDHVRINEFGVAEDTGKFDELLVPKGARFTFSLLLDKKAAENDVSLKDFIQILKQPSFRLGGKTRRGFGAFEIENKVPLKSFDLNNPSDFKAFSEYSFDLSQPHNLPLESIPASEDKYSQNQTRTLELESADFLLPSGGIELEEVFGHDKRWEHGDIFPVYEYEILWDDAKNKGFLSDKPHFFLPATSIKGILRHRTLFYLRVLNRQFLNEKNKYQEAINTPDRAELIDQHLFGTEKTDEQIPGVVLVSEPVFPSETKSRAIQHVALDKFTNSAITGALFTEFVLETMGKTVNINISADFSMLRARKHKNESLLSETDIKFAVNALNLACQDIASGRLALGGGSSRGHGRMKAQKPFQNFTAEE